MSIRAILAFSLFVASCGTLMAEANESDDSTARLMENYDAKTRLLRPCLPNASGEIIVCARNQEEEQMRNRIPLPEERADADANRVAGEIPRASSAPVRKGSCGTVPGDPPICNQGLIVVKTRF